MWVRTDFSILLVAAMITDDDVNDTMIAQFYDKKMKWVNGVGIVSL